MSTSYLCFILILIIYKIQAEEGVSSYTSIRSLDKFGNSVQLMHAAEAPSRHGKLILAACTAKADETSLRLTDTTASNNSVVISISLGRQPVLQPIYGADPTSEPAVIALASTGLKGDIFWLLKEIQVYASHIWERYNSKPLGPIPVAHKTSRLMGSFQDQQNDYEWKSSLPRSESKAARPFGVQTIILSTKSPHILLVEPTGRILKPTECGNVSFVAIGKYRKNVEERLGKQQVEVTPNNLEDLLVDTVLGVLSPARNEAVELTVERMRPNGSIDRKLLVCENGKRVLASITNS